MPAPAIFRKTSTRVWDLSITWSLKVEKLLQPEVPASTTVVTPDRNVKSSGETLEKTVRKSIRLAANKNMRMNID